MSRVLGGAGRITEVAACLIILAILSPVLAVVAIAIKLQDGGPVLYSATRIGQFGRRFRMLKFRTMVAAADRLGPMVTGTSDARVTPLGRLLRRSKLDEVPQLLNVLKGEMGVVGPRPEDPGYVARYPEQFAELLEVRPGLTGAATILFREEEMLLGGGAVEDTYLTRVLPSKLEIELEYLRHRSFFTDAQLVFQTAVWLISHRAPNGVSRAWPRGSERRANG